MTEQTNKEPHWQWIMTFAIHSALAGGAVTYKNVIVESCVQVLYWDYIPTAMKDVQRTTGVAMDRIVLIGVIGPMNIPLPELDTASMSIH